MRAQYLKEKSGRRGAQTTCEEQRNPCGRGKNWNRYHDLREDAGIADTVKSNSRKNK